MGITAAELERLLPALAAELAGARVADAARLAQRDDLLLFVETDGARRCCLQLAPGGQRGRIAITARRFAREQLAGGPAIERLAGRLRGARIIAFTQAPGERRCRTGLRLDARTLALELELFGPRGLWCLLDDDERILELSRPARRGGRTLSAGDRYAPPTPASALAPALPPRFADLAAADAFYTALDQESELAALRARLGTAVEAAQRKLAQQRAGLAAKAEQAARAPELRRQADLLLTFGFAARPGQSELVVPDPERDGARITLALDPSRRPADQAAELYARARKHEKALAAERARERDAERERAALEDLAARLAAASSLVELEAVRAGLVARGLLREPATAPPPAAKKLTRGEDVRRFVSTEGHPIMVGRSNAQNDRLTLHIARGNDLWLHVAGGRAGSHVVVRVPRGKTASLETLLDAGTLAVHFSKARGLAVCEVIYTQRKHVTKPRGAPPGRVVAHHTRTLQVRLEPQRLARLLASAAAPPIPSPPRARPVE